jgi:hypothetical protein
MKRFLSLAALIVVPAIFWAADAAPMQQNAMCSTMDKAKCFVMAGPVSSRDETWAARTDVSVNWEKLPKHLKHQNRSYEMYSVNTIQPIHRSENMHNTLFGYAGLGTNNWDHSSWAVGVGARHLTACTGHMFGIGLGYQDFDVRHVDFRGPGLIGEWMTPYTTLTYGYSWNRLEVEHHAKTGYLHHRRDHHLSNLDLSFQLPYLPWTQLTVGKTWHGERSFWYKHGFKLHHMDYKLRLNLLGCLAVEGGRVGGFKNERTNDFVRLVLSFGRPAANEYVLTDGIIGDVMTPRDLTNYGLAPFARSRVE